MDDWVTLFILLQAWLSVCGRDDLIICQNDFTFFQPMKQGKEGKEGNEGRLWHRVVG